MKRCEKCGVSRTRLHQCRMCGKRLCGCCSFDSRRAGGRVCPGRCHKSAIRLSQSPQAIQEAMAAVAKAERAARMSRFTKQIQETQHG